MHALWKLTWVEMKLFLREPLAAFFTLLFPLMLLFLFGSIYGNEPTSFFEGYGSVDVSVPAYAAMLIATSGLLSLTTFVATYREKGILRRLKATPLKPQAILTSQVVVIFIMTVSGMILLISAGKLFYGLRFTGNPFSVFVAFLLSSFSFFALGFVLASVLPNARASHIIAMVLFYPMIFLSGATIPLETMPNSVRQVAKFLPLTHVVTLFRGLWFGDSWSKHLSEVFILLVLLVLGVFASIVTFRWE